MGRCRAAYCYVNANLLVGLDRRDPRAIRFAAENTGCLYTVANVVGDEVPGARRIAGRYGIQYRVASRGVMERFARAAARLLGALGSRYTLSPNDLKDIDHIAMALATGARYFVTSEAKLCRWIEESRDITGGLRCVDWRTGSCNGLTGRDKAGEARGHEGKRGPRAPRGEARGPKGGRRPRPGGPRHGRLLRGETHPSQGRPPATQARKPQRRAAGKVGGHPGRKRQGGARR